MKNMILMLIVTSNINYLEMNLMLMQFNLQCLWGSIYEQSHQLNASQTSSEDYYLNKGINCNYEDLNDSGNQFDLITIEEE